MIGFLLNHWGWVAAGAAALVLAGVLMNPAAGIAIFGNLAKLAARTFDAVIEWARKPHDWWRIGCLTACAVIALCVVSNVALRAEVARVEERERNAVKSLKTELTTQETATKTTAAAFETCRATLASEVGRRHEIEAERRAALERAKDAQDRADREMSEWRKRYDARPATCTQALKALEAACPTLADY